MFGCAKQSKNLERRLIFINVLISVTIDSAKTGYPVPSKGLKDLQEPRG